MITVLYLHRCFEKQTSSRITNQTSRVILWTGLVSQTTFRQSNCKGAQCLCHYGTCCNKINSSSGRLYKRWLEQVHIRRWAIRSWPWCWSDEMVSTVHVILLAIMRYWRVHWLPDMLNVRLTSKPGHVAVRIWAICLNDRSSVERCVIVLDVESWRWNSRIRWLHWLCRAVYHDLPMSRHEGQPGVDL